MKVMTILGTRPELIRLAVLIPKLDRNCDHVLVHTGQNFDPNLNAVFFEELRIRMPDHSLQTTGGNFGDQIGRILSETDRLISLEKPDRILILGDTNSGLSAIAAKRRQVPVYHMEAGNRCFDDRVPEEVNRRIIDHSSDVLMPYTERSRANLLREGIFSDRIVVTGNPIREVLNTFQNEIDGSPVLSRLELSERKYFLVTIHRAENVDDPDRLQQLLHALNDLALTYKLPIIVSTHPRTRSKLDAAKIKLNTEHIRFCEPFGLFDFVKLEKKALCVITDSGTVQEECCIFGVPNVTVRDCTERPETVECGSNVLSGVNRERLLASVEVATRDEPTWNPPTEYLQTNVSEVVLKVLMSFNLRDQMSGKPVCTAV